MIRIAIIQFPGLNTEYETRREIEKAGMRGEFFRWNDDLQKLKKYDGYVIGGGFSYEDRGRAGIIAALDPIISVLKKETDPEGARKPLLGICNGCQIFIESGLVPGAEGDKICFAMGRNKRMMNGEVLGTGYYNDWIYMKTVTTRASTAFTRLIDENEIIALPVAHGEGRFTTTVPGIIDRLIKNQQIIFRYCDKKGNILPDFPVNPNGSLYNIVALSNPAGNILAIMPHFERSEESQTFFLSMKEYIELKRPKREKMKKLMVSPSIAEAKSYAPEKETLQLFVNLIMNDNEAETFQTTLRRLDFPIEVSRQTHYEIHHRIREKDLPRKLVQSGILLNTNKETVTVQHKGRLFEYFKEKQNIFPSQKKVPWNGVPDMTLLVRDKQDFMGLQKLQTLRRRLGLIKIEKVNRGTLWHLRFLAKNQKERERMFRKILKLNLFANPHSQDLFLI